MTTNVDQVIMFNTKAAAQTFADSCLNSNKLVCSKPLYDTDTGKWRVVTQLLKSPALDLDDVPF